MRNASFSRLLLDDKIERVLRSTLPEESSAQDEESDAPVVQLHRLVSPRRFESRTIYTVSLLLIATVVAWSIVDCRIRIARLEQAVRYLYYNKG